MAHAMFHACSIGHLSARMLTAELVGTLPGSDKQLLDMQLSVLSWYMYLLRGRFDYDLLWACSNGLFILWTSSEVDVLFVG